MLIHMLVSYRLRNETSEKIRLTSLHCMHSFARSGRIHSVVPLAKVDVESDFLTQVELNSTQADSSQLESLMNL